MSSKVEICNLALNHIGQIQIDSLIERSEAAKRCNLVFDSARDQVLRAHAWTFAGATIALAALSEVTTDWSFCYAYPSDCLFVRQVYGEGMKKDPQPAKYDLGLSPDTRAKAILTDVEAAYCDYTVRVENTEAFDGSFVDALSWKIAALIAQPLTGNAGLADVMARNYMQAIEDAKRTNKSEPNSPVAPYSQYIAARS